MSFNVLAKLRLKVSTNHGERLQQARGSWLELYESGLAGETKDFRFRADVLI